MQFYLLSARVLVFAGESLIFTRLITPVHLLQFYLFFLKLTKCTDVYLTLCAFHSLSQTSLVWQLDDESNISRSGN